MMAWRRPKWHTLVVIVGLVMLMGHFVDRLSPSATVCPNTVFMRQDGYEASEFLQHHPALEPQTTRRPVHPAAPLAEPEQRLVEHGLNGIDGPKVKDQEQKSAPFTLISEMNSTSHFWPWREAEDLAKLCRKKDWGALGNLPEVTVIISFHNNEEIFNVLHTLHAVVQHSPPQLLKEIILIDDNTEKDEFMSVLEMHVKSHLRGLVRLVRSNVDLGLIRARLNGIRAATTPVVVVMDSHVEPQHGWLESLLYEIVKDRRTLATPFLDWMQKSGRQWTYRHGASTWLTYFDWSLVFGFQVLPQEVLIARADPTQPIKSPTTVGTVWAMDRKWFVEIGEFDEGMQRWGGENLDLALRVWLFGGRVVNVPCSHVSHLEKDGARAYRAGWTEIIHTNYKRFVEVWLDDYKKYFYQQMPDVKSLEAGDLSSRLAIKSRAKHNFTWYLTNVFPELGIPDRDVYAYGGLQHVEGQCFDSMYRMVPGLAECHPSLIATQGVFWRKDGILRLPINIVMGENLNGMAVVRVYEYTSYHNSKRASRWFHVKDGPLMELSTGKCLEVGKNLDLQLNTCKFTSSQYWRFRVYSKDYDQLENNPSSASPIFKAYLPLLQTMKKQVTAKFQLGRWGEPP